MFFSVLFFSPSFLLSYSYCDLFVFISCFHLLFKNFIVEALTASLGLQNHELIFAILPFIFPPIH